MSAFVSRFELGVAGPKAGVKDTIDIAGIPTMAGTRALEDVVPAASHAEVVDRLLAAGYRIVGKTTLHELAFGMTGINRWAGTPVNTNYPAYVPGGSSSGSAAAVAAGECDVALGTDTGGSIRVPAACCGVWGMKPTWGRVSRRGVMPGQSTLDCVGPLAASAQALIDCMSAIVPDFAPLPSVDGLRIGLLDVAARTDIQAAIEQAVGQFGWPVVHLGLPGMAAAYSAGLAVINAETFAACGHLLPSGKIAPDVATRLQAAATTGERQLAEAEEVRRIFTAEVDAALALCPLLALPTLPDEPPRLDSDFDASKLASLSSLVRPFNLSGHPAIAIPLQGEFPLSLQLVAAKGADELLCAVARHFVLMK